MVKPEWALTKFSEQAECIRSAGLGAERGGVHVQAVEDQVPRPSAACLVQGQLAELQLGDPLAAGVQQAGQRLDADPVDSSMWHTRQPGHVDRHVQLHRVRRRRPAAAGRSRASSG